MSSLLDELVRTLNKFTPPEKLARLLHEHEEVSGHCACCRTVAPCTLRTAGEQVVELRDRRSRRRAEQELRAFSLLIGA